MPSPTRFVVVEGTNGTGKSTLCDALSERMGAASFHFTPEFRRLRKDIRLDERVAPLPRLLVYMAATMHLSDLVRAALADRHVLCDRYVASPVSLMLSDGSMDEAELAEVAAPLEAYCARPDFTILLTVDHDVARRRIEARGDADLPGTPREVVRSPEFLERWRAQLEREVARRGPYVAVDTSGVDPDAVLAASLCALRDHVGLDI